ncbi:MAG: GNAT family N-acetyltransferase [Bauldia sp.]|nr:GNAT family N-acetyltransferase [Bauldia sp.]
MPFQIRRMSIDDLRRVISWAEEEGWNPGRGDAAPFFAADPSGFWMGWLDDEPVASISTVSYGGRFAFVGFYICRPEHRGKGHGLALWRAALAGVGSPVIGLDGVVAQIPNYERSGFAVAHSNHRYTAELAFGTPHDPRLRFVDDGLLRAIIAFDAGLFPAPRDRFLRNWLVGDVSRSGFAIVDDGRVTGYGVIREAVTGRRIGPLFAANADDADLLLRALVALGRKGPVFIDIPEPNRDARALAERHGMTPMFETARMYRGPQPSMPLGRIFGISSLELG